MIGVVMGHIENSGMVVVGVGVESVPGLRVLHLGQLDIMVGVWLE